MKKVEKHLFRIVLFDPRQGMCILDRGYTKEEAEREVIRLRGEGMPAFYQKEK